MNNLYRQIREEYKSKLVENFAQQQLDQVNDETVDHDQPDQMLAHLVGVKKTEVVDPQKTEEYH